MLDTTGRNQGPIQDKLDLTERNRAPIEDKLIQQSYILAKLFTFCERNEARVVIRFLSALANRVDSCGSSTRAVFGFLGVKTHHGRVFHGEEEYETNKIPSPFETNKIPSPSETNKIPSPSETNKIPSPSETDKIPSPTSKKKRYVDPLTADIRDSTRLWT
ncbi:hypothetical protein RRG08_020126 [Elysia crispata]|uniref:Uncharacterized protein n=1 Tax=Elysia crispata TaxID=231223 RepID=A0AAE1DSK2_9GAST|nr:hypothetical protein RRG08_020126 [Elysia crispata]